MPRYKRPEPAPKDPYQIQPLPVDSPVSVYYRQSSEAQIGNISTTLQTVNMVEHLERLGWSREHIIMVDMDAGISGMKRIDERPGMRQIMSMIERQLVRAVAAQDVDRFFRDVTQIETNKFIDACRRVLLQEEEDKSDCGLTGEKSEVDWVPLKRKEVSPRNAAAQYRTGFVPAAGVWMEPA